MYAYTELVYGYDFSDNKYPSIEGETLPDIIYEYLIEGDELKTFYSGISAPYFIGKEIGTFDPFNSKKSLITITNEIQENVNMHSEYYKKEIVNEINEIIRSIKEDAINYKDEYEFTEEDIEKAVSYFTILKTIEPTICSIVATS